MKFIYSAKDVYTSLTVQIKTESFKFNDGAEPSRIQDSGANSTVRQGVPFLDRSRIERILTCCGLA